MKKTLMLALVLSPLAAEAQSVTTYHNGNGRQGSYVAPGLTAGAAANLHLDRGFEAKISGDVRAQPLYWQAKGETTGSLIVVTESNLVYALDAATGAVSWQTRLAHAAPLSAFPCGNIDPEGVTGTPVIDPTGSGTLYLDALTQTGNNAPRQLIYAVSLKTGAVLPNWPIDVESALTAQGVVFSSLTQGQRSGALVFEKNVYIVYGGKSGDCGTYHGTVVQIDPAKPGIVASWSTRANAGGIWSQGGIASDGKSLYTATGNTKGASQWGDGEGIFRLKPGLAHASTTKDYFAPTNWKTLDNDDADLGGTEALPLDISNNGHTEARVIAFGKDGNAYLVNRANFGGISDPLALVPVSNASIITGPAVYSGAGGTLVAFTNQSGLSTCTGSNLTMLSVAASGAAPISQAWCASISGGGAPIITTTDGTSNPFVWVVGAQGDGLLHGYDALTGATVFAGGDAEMKGLHRFQTLIAASGHLYIAADSRMYGFTW